MNRFGLATVVAVFVLLSGPFGMSRLDIDEFRVIKEPYEMLGGDYTVRYLAAGEASRALRCAARSYYLYWQYRPLTSPVLHERDRQLFRDEERRFGYIKPESTRVQRQEVYASRLIVPEPDRFYRHGGGAPLFTAFLRIPSLALVKLVTRGGPDLLHYQFHRRYHPIFLLPRLQGILAGLCCILLVHRVLSRNASPEAALRGAAIMACVPPAVMYFPNLHYDAILAPLVLAAAYDFVRDRHGRGGLWLGLAMASKNTGILLLPAAVAYVLVETLRLRSAGQPAEAARYWRRKGRGLVVFGLVGVVALAPFANPISQLREILTPVVSRPFDPRGEDLSRYHLATLPPPAAGPGQVALERPLVTRLKTLVGYDLSLLMVLLGLPLIWSRPSLPVGRLAFVFLLMSFPYRLVFGGGLGYRSLMFLPFFAVLAALSLERRALLVILALLATLSFVFALDPITATGLPYVGEPSGSAAP